LSKINLKKSLKEYRELKLLTQQELADKSGISIRTIQRIEKNNTAGSPYVIKALCKVLGIEVSEIYSSDEKYDHEESIANATRELQKLKFINFSPIFILFLPFLNILVPYLFFIKYKKSLLNKNDALKMISFQILWLIFSFVLIFGGTALLDALFGMKEYAGYPPHVWIFLICILLNLFAMIDTSIRLNESKYILPYSPNIL